MGRTTKDDGDQVTASTLRWRKFNQKRQLEDPGYQKSNVERAKQARRKKVTTETSEQKKLRLKAESRAKKENRDALKYSNDAFASPNALGKATNRVLNALPQDLQKRLAVFQNVAKKLHYSKDDIFPKPKIPDIHKMAIDFYYSPRVSYTMPGTHDTMVIRDSNGKTTVRKYYLTVFVREAYAMFFESHGPILKHTTFHRLRPQNVLLMQQTPRDVCKCSYHENFQYQLKALGLNYDGSVWDTLLCDADLRSYCWSNKCTNCKNFSQLTTEKDLTSMTKLQRWQKDKSKHVKLVTTEIPVEEVLTQVKISAATIYRHIHVKRIQCNAFDIDKQLPNTRSTQFDFAMNFTSEIQSEVQSALWGRASIVLFTVASKLNGSDTTMIVCSTGVSKNKNTVFAFLHEVLHRLPDINDPSINEVFWSDGPSSEFKNKFMFSVLRFFATKYKKTFTLRPLMEKGWWMRWEETLNV